MFCKKNILLFFFLFLFGISGFFAQQTHIDSLEAKLKTIADDTSRALTLLELAEELSGSDSKKSESYLKEALELSQRLSFKNGIAKSYYIFGNLSENDSRYGDAIIQLGKALKVYNEIGDKKKISN